jgi:hypothetical protein
MKYRIHLKDFSYIDTDSDGNIVYDSSRNYRRTGTPDWRILGVTTRHNSRHIIPLKESVTGNIGQGWIHDMDHGTHRMWSRPSGKRAVHIETLTEERGN